ncbi:MarR family winged helix-turn-helix transcriptional regulator [Glaciimonas sp. GG7]
MNNPVSNNTPLFQFDTYQIEDSIGYLLARTRAMLTKSSDELLSDYGVTHGQAAILLMLSTGKYSTAADLTRETFTDAASMKRMIDRLNTRGLISREPCPLDRRLVKLGLTDDGVELAKKVPLAFCAVLNQHFEGFTAEEIGFLKSLLRRALANNTQNSVIKIH